MPRQLCGGKPWSRICTFETIPCPVRPGSHHVRSSHITRGRMQQGAEAAPTNSSADGLKHLGSTLQSLSSCTQTDRLTGMNNAEHVTVQRTVWPDRPTERPTDQPTNQPTNQPVNQPANQPTSAKAESHPAYETIRETREPSKAEAMRSEQRFARQPFASPSRWGLSASASVATVLAQLSPWKSKVPWV